MKRQKLRWKAQRMNPDILSNSINDSFTMCIVNKIGKVISNSKTYRIFLKINAILYLAFFYSRTKVVLENNNSVISNNLKKSDLYILIKKLFKKLIYTFSHYWNLAFKDSSILLFLKTIKNDLFDNSIKYFSYMVFCWLTLYSILVIVFGSGFTKSEVEIIIIFTFIFFVFSRSSIDIKNMFEDSFFIKWIKIILN
jgi:hypothetical protein